MKDSALCKVCGKDLATCDTIIAAEGLLYCSRTCCIHDYEYSCQVDAEQHVNEVAEEINPADIGLKRYMKRDEILATIKSLAGSQGFYSCMYNLLTNASEEEYDKFMSVVEAQNIRDAVDLALFLEG